MMYADDRPFTCNICDKKFRKSQHLTYHKQTHTGEKPFKCNICGQSCRTNSDLTRHKRIHTGDRPYECRYCQEKFRQLSHLQIHERIQHNRPKIKCTWEGCNVEFNRLGDRMKHIRAHHDPTPYHCDKCNRKYKLKRDLDHHKRKHQIMKTRKMQQK